jgi:hypothetical protein
LTERGLRTTKLNAENEVHKEGRKHPYKQRGETKQLYGREENMTAASLATSDGH